MIQARHLLDRRSLALLFAVSHGCRTLPRSRLDRRSARRRAFPPRTPFGPRRTGLVVAGFLPVLVAFALPSVLRSVAVPRPFLHPAPARFGALSVLRPRAPFSVS